MSSAAVASSAVPPRARTAPRRAAHPAYAGPDSFAQFLERILKYPDNCKITVRELLGGLESRAYGIPLAALSAGGTRARAHSRFQSRHFHSDGGDRRPG